VGILPAGAFDEADVRGAAGPDFLDYLGLFRREKGEKGARGGGMTCDAWGGVMMWLGEAGERIVWERGEGVGCLWGRKRSELRKKIERRKAKLRNGRSEGLGKISQLMLIRKEKISWKGFAFENKLEMLGQQRNVIFCESCETTVCGDTITNFSIFSTCSKSLAKTCFHSLILRISQKKVQGQFTSFSPIEEKRIDASFHKTTIR
jgi:hypothetical protein